MILNTGGRTDTVQYYSEWLLNRFREGYVLSRNPLFPNIVNRIELNSETLDVVVFCSKDYSPILSRRLLPLLIQFQSDASAVAKPISGHLQTSRDKVYNLRKCLL
jgi:hypothetical protein